MAKVKKLVGGRLLQHPAGAGGEEGAGSPRAQTSLVRAREGVGVSVLPPAGSQGQRNMSYILAQEIGSETHLVVGRWHLGRGGQSHLR